MTPSSVHKREWTGVNNNQGSNWIRRPKRIAIYLRDGWRCVWCGHKGGTHKSPGLSLDHLIPRGARGGTNHHRNLVTSCLDCNRTKGHMTLRQWANHLGSDGDVQIMRVVERARKAPLDMVRAKKIVAKRKGTFSHVHSTSRVRPVLPTGQSDGSAYGYAD